MHISCNQIIHHTSKRFAGSFKIWCIGLAIRRRKSHSVAVVHYCKMLLSSQKARKITFHTWNTCIYRILMPDAWIYQCTSGTHMVYKFCSTWDAVVGSSSKQIPYHNGRSRKGPHLLDAVLRAFLFVPCTRMQMGTSWTCTSLPASVVQWSRSSAAYLKVAGSIPAVVVAFQWKQNALYCFTQCKCGGTQLTLTFVRTVWPPWFHSCSILL